jgi:hypothetical protein
LVKLNEEEIGYIEAIIDHDYTLTLDQIRVKLRDELEVQVSHSTIANMISKFKNSFKRLTTIAIAAETPERQVERREYSQWLLQKKNNNNPLIFIDEVGFIVTSRVGYGRARIGNRPRIIVLFEQEISQ